jgi:TonB-linked SusC/RagA family outer membrane protein
VRSLTPCVAVLVLLAAPTWAAAQEREVSGTVVRESGGQPIPEATITLVGGTAGTKTNGQGRFTIGVSGAEPRLVIRAIGYQRLEIVLPAGQTTVDVALKEDILKLEEIVVSGQQTGVERRNATTASAIVSGEELTRVPAASVDEALQGKVAGAFIQQNSGGPGGGLQVRIRGANTAVGSPDPIFVVDGVIYSDATLPSGLFSVTASSSNRGHGEQQDDAVNRVADLNPNEIASIEILKGAAASSIYGSKAANGVVLITTNRGKIGKPKVNVTQRLGFFELLRGPGFRAFDTTSAFATFPALDPAVIRSYEVNGKLKAYDDLQALAGNKPFAWETLADVSGGNENTKYYVSGGWKSDKGIINNTGAEKQSLRFNLDQRLGERLNLAFNGGFTRNVTDRGITNNDNSGASVTYAIAYIPSFIPLTNADGSPRPLEVAYKGSNPIQTALLSTNRESVNRFTGGANLTYNAIATPHSSLKFVAAGGADLFNQSARVIAPPELFFQQTVANPGISARSTGDSRNLNWNLNAIHTYSPGEGGFRATTSFGAQYEDRDLSRTRVVAEGLLGGQTNIDQGSVFGQQFEATSKERTFAFYGQEEFLTMHEKLLIAAGARAERSSANGDQGKYYLFPKLSASYRFPNLFGEGSEFKIRGAYGQTGNQPLFGQKFTTLAGGQVIGGVIGTTVDLTSGLANVKPERLKEFEGGIDASLWNGRATVEVTGFSRKTQDLLLNRTPAPSSGFTSEIINGGVFRNTGIEVALGVTPVQTRSASWLVRSTFARIRSNVDTLPDGLSFRPENAGFGLAFGEFFVQQGRPVQQIVGQVPNAAGGFDIVQLGDANPNFRLSLSNDITYKSLFVSFLWDWQQGGVAQNQTLSLYDCNNLAPDGGTAAGQARYDACNSTGDARPFVQSTSFVKLREATIGISLPRSWSRAFAGANDVRVSLTGRNLLLFTDYFGYDPEVSNYGQQAIVRNIDLGPYPPMRSFFFNVTVGF